MGVSFYILRYRVESLRLRDYFFSESSVSFIAVATTIAIVKITEGGNIYAPFNDGCFKASVCLEYFDNI